MKSTAGPPLSTSPEPTTILSLEHPRASFGSLGSGPTLLYSTAPQRFRQAPAPVGRAWDTEMHLWLDFFSGTQVPEKGPPQTLTFALATWEDGAEAFCFGLSPAVIDQSGEKHWDGTGYVQSPPRYVSSPITGVPSLVRERKRSPLALSFAALPIPLQILLITIATFLGGTTLLVVALTLLKTLARA